MGIFHRLTLKSRPQSPPRRRTTIGCYLLLADDGPLLGEPYTNQLDGKLRELRFHLERDAVRITCWIASGERIILLAVFRKTRDRETSEVERLARALDVELAVGFHARPDAA